MSASSEPAGRALPEESLKQLPPEVWAIIYAFAAEAEGNLSGLALVNRASYEAVSQRRFRSVCFDFTNPKSRAGCQQLSAENNARLCSCILQAKLVPSWPLPLDMVHSDFLSRIRKILARASELEKLESTSPCSLANCEIRSPLKHLRISVRQAAQLPAPSSTWQLRHLQIELERTYSQEFSSSISPILRQCVGTIEVLGIPVAEECLAVLANMTSLRSFRVTGPAAPELLERVVEVLPPAKLQSLGLFGTTILESTIGAVSRLVSLEEVDLRGDDWRINHDSTRSGLRSLGRLARLALHGNSRAEIVAPGVGPEHPRFEGIYRRATNIARRVIADEVKRYTKDLHGLESILITTKIGRETIQASFPPADPSSGRLSNALDSFLESVP